MIARTYTEPDWLGIRKTRQQIVDEAIAQLEADLKDLRSKKAKDAPQ